MIFWNQKMNNNLTQVNFHGVLGKKLGKKTWNVKVSSVTEALHAVDCLTSSKLYSNINNLSSKGVKYLFKVNNEIQSNTNSANPLNLQRENIKTIDVVPVVEGAFFGALGAVFGAGLLYFGDGAVSKIIGATLLFAGMSDALSKPPEKPEDRLITNPSSDPQALSQSYLFGGPVNVINEGGPVPIGYGRLLVGSQVILTSYEIEQELVENA